MIEKYFIKGARLKWICPKEETTKPKDGGIMANPLRAANAMVYDGMDGELINLTHASTAGLKMKMNIGYKWLCYAPGRTTKLNIASDVLTGFMSGCYITTWSEQGKSWVAHVGTIDNNPAVSKKVKSTFADSMPQNTQGFEPASVWSHDEIFTILKNFKQVPSTKIMALVTSSKQFYSILMLSVTGSQNKEWVVGGIKKVPPKNYTVLKQALK